LRSFLTPSIGTVWPAHGLTRQLCTRSTPFRFNFAGYISTPLRSDGHKLPRQAGNGRALPRLKNRESGQLSLRCRAGDLNWQVRLAPARNSPPSLQITGNGLTPRPSVCAPGYVAAHVALAALRQTLRQMVEESA